ncbi:MAG: TIGR00282 family metallophosphoesterase [Pseudomonadota bacterium]|nr:TIGR00282 family metallophosphoesterase [Pseudomonadota bacterium]
MKILLLGDVCGPAGMKIVKLKLNEIIKEKKIDFTVVNGENAADSGKGITKKNFKDLINSGVDVITSGNHIWDQKEILEIIDNEKKLIRPANLLEGQPGSGYGIYEIKDKKIAVINLIGNVFMKKSQDLFSFTEKFIKKIKLKKDADFIVIDIHGEITSEKMALGHFLDGKVTTVVGTHTHVPTSDTKILKNGTAYQTDLGMCGDYDSVIGMNKENSIKKFKRDPSAESHFPANGDASISGVIVDADDKTGLANNIDQIIIGGNLKQKT